ncbi:MAG: gamma-glutamyltransferase family protein [Ramlibacter sp.]|nr:gamma-glutamyltransferase family protein [Ramlibacter sp.]
MRSLATALVSLAAALLAAACAAPSVPDQSRSATQPEAASGYTAKPGWAVSRFAVAAANPIATEAGYNILKAGGTAVDAAIATQLVLGLVEPQSSGIGGGAFLLHFDGKSVEAFDGRETAPAAADANLFLAADGKPISFSDAVAGGRAVGTPGATRMLESAHRQHGKLAWSRLFEPAITLAEGGFPVSRRLNTLLQSDPHLRNDPVASEYFYDGSGNAKPAGTLLRNPEYAVVLRRLAARGSQALHEGAIAQAIVQKVRNHPTNPGRLALEDLQRYQVRKREPICHDYRARARDLRICGFPPPSSGAIAVGQILGILGQLDAQTIPLEDGLPGAAWLHLYTEAARLAFADRAQYIADPDFVPAPGGNWMTLLEPAYLTERARLIGPQSRQAAPPGSPAGSRLSFAPMPEQPEYGTSHISIVDGSGNALALTTTIEAQFGSRLMVNPTGGSGGFLLNNELTDFSFTAAGPQGQPVANRVEPGKRPRSSMSPTLVFDKTTGQVLMTAGSPGGAFIIHFTAKTLYGVLNWGLDAQQAINLPNFGTLGGPTFVEAGRFPPGTLDALRSRGAKVQEEPMPSGIQALQRTPQGWFGGSDPRREGIVMGD